MRNPENRWIERIKIFSNILITWKIFGAICVVIAAPTYERMREDVGNKITHDWFNNKLIITVFLINAFAGYLARTKFKFISLSLFFIMGSVYFAHYIYICKVDVLSIFLAYWEFFILLFMMWRLYKEDGQLK